MGGPHGGCRAYRRRTALRCWRSHRASGGGSHRCGVPGTRGNAARSEAVIPVGIYVVNRAALECIPPRGFFDIKEHLFRSSTWRGACPGPPDHPGRARVLNAQTYLAVNGMVTEALVSGKSVPSGFQQAR